MRSHRNQTVVILKRSKRWTCNGCGSADVVQEICTGETVERYCPTCCMGLIALAMRARGEMPRVSQ